MKNFAILIAMLFALSACAGTNKADTAADKALDSNEVDFSNYHYQQIVYFFSNRKNFKEIIGKIQANPRQRLRCSEVFKIEYVLRQRIKGYKTYAGTEWRLYDWVYQIHDRARKIQKSRRC